MQYPDLFLQSLRATVAKEFLVFDTLGRCTLAPQSKTGWLQRFSHMGDHFALGETGDFINFLKGDTIGPSSPNDPIRTILGWFRFFHTGDGFAGLFGLRPSNI